jgi:hypothetical protein
MALSISSSSSVKSSMLKAYSWIYLLLVLCLCRSDCSTLGWLGSGSWLLEADDIEGPPLIVFLCRLLLWAALIEDWARTIEGLLWSSWDWRSEGL